MVYLYKNQDTFVSTDNVLDYSYDTYDVFLNDIHLGLFTNMSETNNYIKFLIPGSLLNLQEKEYTLKLVSSFITIKEELAYVKNMSIEEIKEHTKTTTVKFYEKN